MGCAGAVSLAHPVECAREREGAKELHVGAGRSHPQILYCTLASALEACREVVRDAQVRQVRSARRLLAIDALVLRNRLVVVPRLPVHDGQLVAGLAHPGVERERMLKRLNRLLLVSLDREYPPEASQVCRIARVQGRGTLVEPDRIVDLAEEAMEIPDPVEQRGRLHPAGEHAGHNLQRSEEHTSELQSPDQLVCRLLLEKK